MEKRTYSLDIRTRDTSEDMVVESIGVPYNTETRIFSDYFETIAPGAVIDRDHRPLLYMHDEPIGTITDTTDTPEGWSYRARISDTPRGREVYTLLKDGVIRSSSIGFEPLEQDIHTDEQGLHVTRTAIDIREVSLVPIPAYDTATVTAVRQAQLSEGATMTDTLNLDDIRDQLAEHERAIHTLTTSASQPTQSPEPQFRSIGDYAKALASTSDSRHDTATREFSGSVLADTITHPAWVGDVISIIKARQKLTDKFLHTYDLPPATNVLEYGVLKSSTLDVTEQKKEGDDLPVGKIAITSKTASIKTYGGATTMSRQAIERASVNLLDLAFQGMAMEYGKAIEEQTRAIFTAAHTAALKDSKKTVKLGDTAQTALKDATADTWLATVLALAELFDDKNVTLSGLIASKDVFLALAKVPESAKMLQITGAPDDKAGTLTVSVPSAHLYGIEVVSIPGLAANTLAAYDKRAIRVQEAPGVPYRLQDSNILNLTEEFAIYGYAAHYQQLDDGIIAVNVTGAGA